MNAWRSEKKSEVLEKKARRGMLLSSLSSQFFSLLDQLAMLITFKVAIIVLAMGGFLFGSSFLVKQMFRDPLEEVVLKKDIAMDIGKAFPKLQKAQALDKMSLPSDEVRRMALEGELESNRLSRGKDSLAFIKKSKGVVKEKPESNKAVDSPKPKSKPAEKSKITVASAQKPAKIKPKLEGFDEHPEVGSVSGFRLRTSFGSLTSNNKSVSNFRLPGTLSQAPSLLAQKSSSKESRQNEDEEGEGSDEEEDSDNANLERLSTCYKVCANQNRLSSVKLQSSCFGTSKTWLDGICVDSKKFESCAKTNALCKK